MSIIAQLARAFALIAVASCDVAFGNQSPPQWGDIIIEGDTSEPVTEKSHVGVLHFAALTPGRREHTTVSPEPFGLQVVAATSNEVSAKWQALQSHLRADEETLAQCRTGTGDCPATARGLLQIIEQGRKRQGRARIGVINRAINLSIRPVRDLAQHGLDDVWSSPLATLAAGAGDCEDYAIAKYVALHEAGISTDDLRLVIVYDVKYRLDHAVVAVRFDGEWLLLDNRHLVLLSAGEAPNYHPLFVLDRQGVSEFRTAKLGH